MLLYKLFSMNSMVWVVTFFIFTAQLFAQSEETPVTPTVPMAPLAEEYKEAYEEITLWLKEISSKIAALDEKISQIQVKIQENEAIIARLKAEAVSTEQNKEVITPPTEPKTPAAPKTGEIEQLLSVAQFLAPLVEGYKKAYEEITLWLKEVSGKTAAVNEKINQLKVKIQENEAALTRLKLESTKESKVQMKELDKQNKELWNMLSAAIKEKALLYSTLLKTAAAKVKEISDSMMLRLKEIRTQLKE